MEKIFTVEFVLYITAGTLSLRFLPKKLGSLLFCFLNIGFFFHLFGTQWLVASVAYVLLVSLHFYLCNNLEEKTGLFHWVVVLFPVATLFSLRYFPISWYSYFSFVLPKIPISPPVIFFAGFSYMSFRLSRAALEIKSRQVVNVKWWEYASFAFFVPTTLVGPINPLKKHINSLRNNKPTIKDYIWSLCRLVIGTGKLFFLGTLLQRLTYDGLFFDGHPHGVFDLFISGVFYYLYLYVNFSGFCDIAIGSAGLMGIEVVENFDNPLAARNIKNFWNRWHITLSHYVRDVFFSPLSRSITHWFGPSHVQHAIALTILLIFLFIGVWHGDGWNFLLFGLVHALGMIFHHYYTLYLKRKLGSNGFENYNINKIIHCIAVTITFIYVAFSMSLFANSLTSLRKIAFILQ